MFMCCVCRRVFTTHSGLVTSSVATPAPAAAAMWIAGVAGICRPQGRVVSVVFNLPYTVKYTCTAQQQQQQA
jgi:hypothetical protein